jgi:PAS domain-containing protein
MNGGEFLRQVSERWPETVRIVLSGYADISAVIAAINDGAIFKFVTKPWQEHELKDAVKDAVHKQHAMEQMRELAELALRTNDNLADREQQSSDDIHRRNLDLEQLTDSLIVFREVFYAAPVPLLVVSEDAEIVPMNDSASATLGIVRDGAHNDNSSSQLPQALLDDAMKVLHNEPIERRSYSLRNDSNSLWHAHFASIFHENGTRSVAVALTKV